MPFGQVVVGPPGSGKSTYCHGMQQLLGLLGRRPVLVNLDPANELVPYQCDVSVGELFTVEQMMQRQALGPNGALLACLEALEGRVDWLIERLESFEEEGRCYFVFDLPGQVELTSCHPSLLAILEALERRNFRLTVVHLADAAHCVDPTKYLSMLIVTLKCMLQLGRPQINVLSKVDLVETFGALPLRLEYYLNVQDLRYLLGTLDDAVPPKLRRLSEALCELVEEAGLLYFVPLAVEDRDCMTFLLGEIDKANGYIFGGLTEANESIHAAAASQAHREHLIELVTERYISRDTSVTQEDAP